MSISSLIDKAKVYEEQLDKLDDKFMYLIEESAKLSFDPAGNAKKEDLTEYKALMMGITKEEWEQQKWANETLKTKSFGVTDLMRNKAVNSEIAKVEQEIANVQKEQLKNQVAIERSATVWGRALNGIGPIFKSLWKDIKAIGTMFVTGLGIGVVVSLLTAVVQKVVQWAKEQRKIKNLAYDTQAAAEKAASGVNEQIGRMEALYKIVTDTDKREERRKRSLKEINNLLGDQKFELEDIKTNSDKVKEAIDKWKTSLKQAARASAYFSQIQKLEA